MCRDRCGEYSATYRTGASTWVSCVWHVPKIHKRISSNKKNTWVKQCKSHLSRAQVRAEVRAQKDYLHIITCSLALCIKASSSGLEAMRPWINLGSGSPLISSQRGQPQGGTLVHMGSQVMDSDSVSPPRVVVRREAAPLWLRDMPDMQDVMGTSPAPVAASQMNRWVQPEATGKTARGSAYDSSTNGYRLENDESARRPATGSGQLGSSDCAQWSPSSQTGGCRVQAWPPDAAMQLLEQKKDEWKRQVGSMQAGHQQQVETQRYEVAAAAPARAGGDDEGAPLPASWLRRASFVDPRDRLVHCLTQVVTFLWPLIAVSHCTWLEFLQVSLRREGWCFQDFTGVVLQVLYSCMYIQTSRLRTMHQRKESYCRTLIWSGESSGWSDFKGCSLLKCEQQLRNGLTFSKDKPRHISLLEVLTHSLRLRQEDKGDIRRGRPGEGERLVGEPGQVKPARRASHTGGQALPDHQRSCQCARQRGKWSPQ